MIDGEVHWRGWTPDIEGIMRRIVFGLPVAVGRDIVDISGIFRIAAPGVAHIMEVVRAEHMAPEAPAGAEALVRHLHGAEADLVDRADIPAEMMQARAFRLGQRDQVMIAAMDAVHEGNAVTAAIREPQPQ